MLYVLLLREVEDARPRQRPSPSFLKRATAPRVTHDKNYVADDPSNLQNQECSPRASHVRQVIKRRTIAHLKTTENYAVFGKIY